MIRTNTVVIPEKIILGIDPGTTVMGYGVIRAKGNRVEMIDLGFVDLHKIKDHYLTLKEVFAQVSDLIAKYLPDEMAIEAPFFGKNVQSMLKLGRAQGVAITAAIMRDVPITEYAPLKIKMAITGNGSASKEQVCDMLRRILKIPEERIPNHLDATDGLAAAYCHFLQSNRPDSALKYSSWKDFVARNGNKVSKQTGRMANGADQ